MQFQFEGRCLVTMEHKQGDKKSSAREIKILLDVSDNLDKSQYLDKDDLPTANGSKALTIAFIQGIVANIKQAHHKGFWDESEHIRYIIDELHRGFVTDGQVSESKM